jgi:hypothetical protein
MRIKRGDYERGKGGGFQANVDSEGGDTTPVGAGRGVNTGEGL